MQNSRMFHRWTCFSLLVLTASCVPQFCLGQTSKSGSPERNLPPNIIQLTAFGERAVYSPDGKHIAFMGKSYGDAFEIDLQTKMIRLLSTAKFRTSTTR